jgi:Ca2+/Na+ antiporter
MGQSSSDANSTASTKRTPKPPHFIFLPPAGSLTKRFKRILQTSVKISISTINSTIATTIGISERIISLTVIALGTSLPELVTTITAARKGESDLLVGNIVGSNIFNICIVLALPVVFAGGITPNNFQTIDLIMLIFSSILVCLLARHNHEITRLDGALMLIIFTVYYGYLIYGAFA